MKRIVKLSDVIARKKVIKDADRLSEEFYEAQAEEETDELEAEASELMPVEELSCQITDHLAHKTAQNFEEILDGMEMDPIRQIIDRLGGTDSKTATEMIQAMFLLKGKDYVAKDLDLIGICWAHNEAAYDDFILELFEEDEFDWIMSEISLLEAIERTYKAVRFS